MAETFASQSNLGLYIHEQTKNLYKNQLIVNIIQEQSVAIERMRCHLLRNITLKPCLVLQANIWSECRLQKQIQHCVHDNVAYVKRFATQFVCKAIHQMLTVWVEHRQVTEHYIVVERRRYQPSVMLPGRSI